MRQRIKEKIEVLCCPVCGKDLESFKNTLMCSSCKSGFSFEGEIPMLFVQNDLEASKGDVTDVVKSFYERNPFPNYDEIDTIWRFREKAEKGLFAQLLDEQIPLDALILEAGCGTGQLSNFLGIKCRTVFATDICMNSLKLGENFRERNQLDSVYFSQMNLFRPAFPSETFDIIICNGVLHHTSNPFLGLKTLTKLIKRGGYLIVGLYNKYGRLTTDFRRLIFKITGDRVKSLDPRLRKTDIGQEKRNTWFLDQYKNPHESKHTLGGIQKWFEKCSLEFVNSIPKAVAFEPFPREEKLFEQNPRGTLLDHFLVQAAMLLTGGKEGGFFTIIGRKK